MINENERVDEILSGSDINSQDFDSDNSKIGEEGEQEISEKLNS